MEIEMIGIILTLAILATILIINNYKGQKEEVPNMSFKESMDLTELPVVTFCCGNKKLNFLLDTGSNVSQINSSVLPLLNYKKVEDGNMGVTGIEGNIINTEFCELTISYKNQEFVNDFCIHDLSDAFDIVKKESGVQIHGILGSLFFQKYKYILDFENLIAHSKK